MIVDAHHHLWDPERAHYPALTDEVAAIRRRYTPADLEPHLRARGVDGTIVVQARSSVEETRELLAFADAVPWILGVVGWVDLTAESIELDGLAGVRHQVHDEPDPDWLLRSDVQRGLAAVAATGLPFDLLVRARELPAAIETVRRMPELQFVLDHLGKPPLRDGAIDDWSRLFGELARCPNVACKLSGLVTEADWTEWRAEQLVPFLHLALEEFGAERCLFGSDWPVCELAGGYDAALDLVVDALEGSSADERAAVLGGTALRIYT